LKDHPEYRLVFGVIPYPPQTSIDRIFMFIMSILYALSFTSSDPKQLPAPRKGLPWEEIMM